MLRRCAIVVIFACLAAAAATATASFTRPRHPVDATPFAHAPCSALRGRPCTPSYCSVFNHGPCIPEIDYPIGENLQLTVLSLPAKQDAGNYQKPDHELNTIADLFAMLRACWAPPAPDAARRGMQMSVSFSFKRDGQIIAPPRLTYATPGTPLQTREAYRHAIDDALARCAPLPLTKGLGGAIAGRPIMVRYVDNRSLERPSAP
jgi:hypothetical protein